MQYDAPREFKVSAEARQALLIWPPRVAMSETERWEYDCERMRKAPKVLRMNEDVYVWLEIWGNACS